MKLPITDGESGRNMTYPHNVVHVNGGYEQFPPAAGDHQGIAYKSGWLCKHEETATFFWVHYSPRISSRKGIVCKHCGTITWSYRDL